MLRVLGSGAYIKGQGGRQAGQAHGSGVYPYAYASVGEGYEGWETPRAFAEQLQAVCGVFDLDPCAARKRGEATVRARVRFTRFEDGLSLPWFGSVFMNPPYRSIAPWMVKARDEAQAGRVRLVVALIPVRTDTAYWHDIITQADGILLLKGRLKFSEHKYGAPFPSAIVIWGGSKDTIAAVQAAFACVRVNMEG